MGKKRNSHGGKRVGAGRPVGSGPGPSKNQRKNRVSVMFSDQDFRLLKKAAKEKGLALATLVFKMLSHGLSRLK